MRLHELRLTDSGGRIRCRRTGIVSSDFLDRPGSQDSGGPADEWRPNYKLPRRANGGLNCGSVSQGNRIQVSWETSVMKLSTSARPAGFA